MRLAESLLNLYEVKYEKEVGKATPASRKDANASEDVSLKTEYRLVFDFSQFNDFPLTDEMDISAWVDDVISKSKLEKRIDELFNKELSKHKWFTDKFDSASVEITSVEHNEKVSGLEAVAVHVKLEFNATVSLVEAQLAPALTGIIPTLNGELKLAGSLLDEKNY